ncbi:thiamine pyrophosphate-binding protein [Arenibaculum sp.]|uniref:thiamine pyrophosphate-binding protein n=1 Tax=Arenibaculum sp. TaxID=2865862 RepID=UPI002E14881D|nr:thiamine pyrophosphate-binding protein [Arenibaculum sp.]
MSNLDDIERPTQGGDASVWGSDVIAELLRRLGLRYVALNPGASFRGLHDSLVNWNGNRDPQMILCLHEEHAVAIAHGYAKVTGEPMAVILHSNVGLLHGSMGIFNAWVDRMPVLVLGATGPVDAAKRRPWIDWIHTAQDQGALVRPFVKWDDQPASVPATVEAILRANLLSRTAPCGPTYVCMDAAVQEGKLDGMPELPEPRRFTPPQPSRPGAGSVAETVRLLEKARSPVILAGRGSRGASQWRRRIALAQALGAKVATDLKAAAAFPTDHPLHVASPGYFLDADALGALREADVILSLDWIDLAGSLKLAFGAAGPAEATVVQASIDHVNHSGWSKDHQALAPVDIHLASDPDTAVSELCAAFGLAEVPAEALEDFPTAPIPAALPEEEALDIPGLAAALGKGLGGAAVTFLRLPLGWDGALWHFRHPLDYLGGDGGGGLGSGPGMAVGAALALRGGPRLPVAVLGDGDFVMASSAIWTAAHYRIPMLVVVCNNGSFYNDEVHQERVARERGRPVENKWIGQRISDPAIDVAGLARSYGADAIGPVSTPLDLARAVEAGARLVGEGRVCVIDARVQPGYSKAMATSLNRKPS